MTKERLYLFDTTLRDGQQTQGVQFSSDENLALFRANPEQYAPRIGGYCTFGIVLQKKFDGDPQCWLTTDSRVQNVQRLQNKFVRMALQFPQNTDVQSLHTVAAALTNSRHIYQSWHPSSGEILVHFLLPSFACTEHGFSAVTGREIRIR